MVSIIIPVYNREQYIEECIRSIQAQTYKNYEIILIDDGSTDNTLSLCRSLAATEPAIRIFESGHGGVSAARNLGLDAAKGDFVFFVDSDDIIHPQLLEVLVNGLKETDAAIAGTQCVSVWEQYWHKVYEYIEENPGPGETTYQNFEDTLEAVFGGETPLAMIGGVMMRRDIIGDTRFRTDLYIGEDFFFIYENMIKGGSTVFLKQKWYFARDHASNSSWDFGYTGFMNRLLRRELVWKSEEMHGRPKYAAIQKNAAFGLYGYFVNRKGFPRNEKRKIKKVLRAYGKTLFPDLYPGNKVLYILYIWIPGGFALAQKIWPSVLKVVHKFRPGKQK